MIQRVAVFGTESTGKTTLARRLATYFDAPWAPEYVRDFWIQRDGDIRGSDLATIARGQIASEDAAAQRAEALLICDTELITNTLFADLLFPGQCPPWVRKTAEHRSREYALYLLCDTDIAFEDDGQRCFSDTLARQRCRKLWRDALERRDLPFVDIFGPLPQRIDSAATAITRATGITPSAC